MSSAVKEWIGLLARLLTGGVWIAAGAVKLPAPHESVAAVRAYDLLPEVVVPTVGQLLPVLEVVIGLALVLGVLTRGASVVSAVLFAAFIIAIASVWARGMTIDCGCFGGGGADPDAASQYPWEIARDAGLLLASAYLVALPRTRLALDNLLFQRRTPLPLDLTDPIPEGER
ncbi:Methylamine utilization protein MauE [Nocardioides dokdonensis FR1436]|uniref:Methylamine utilization protein MauE n=1 Tax=Nocardioides dokdonensis FR1436 TaxID=1300347 RepID=A0A1A9GK96_9ACTN|nr:MauE/DoxX family redox-associated membrane protein [Nocardioides dokdonensis]ANH38767.1 Methylamine utilization protein MauE [Nocardioides dokdonensis FR1436]